jgi:hypothetical protein
MITEKEIADLVLEALSTVEKGVSSKVGSPKKNDDYLKPPTWTAPQSLENLKLTEDPFTKDELNSIISAVDNAIETQTAAKQGVDVGVQILKAISKILPLFLV